MLEFVVEIAFTLPGYFILTCFFDVDPDSKSGVRVVLVSILFWIACCAAIYGVSTLLISYL